MTLKTTGECYALLALMGILFAGLVFAQSGRIQATIFLIGVQTPFLMSDFTINDERFYDAVRQGKNVKLPFRDLREVRFLNPGKNFEAEVLFNDGRKETYSLRPAADITIDDGATDTTMSHLKVARIQFAPQPAQPPPQDTQPALQQPRPKAAPATSDRVVLRNGDSLSGHIQTKIFPLRTAYGTFQLEAMKVASVEFDATRPNMAVVLLKNGDRLSGTVETDPVPFVMTSGQGVSLDCKTIKSIQFKR